MTNDAAVAWVVVDQTLRKDSPDPNFMNGAYWTSFETVSADRALSVVKERQSIRPTGEYEVIALVPAATVAELRAEVECLRVELAGSQERALMVLRAKDDWMERANKAERRVAELEAGLASARRAIGDHHAPNDCYATGPLTGDEFLDLVQCPACAFFDQYAALTKESP